MPKINRWVLGFFLAVLWPSVLILCAKESAPDAASSQNIVPSVSDTATPGIDSAIQMAQEEIRDPFAKAQPPEVETPEDTPVAEAAPEVNAELQGIGFGSKDAYAVIGGEVFYNGDQKNGIKLLEVRRREVDILMNGGKVTISLFPDEALKMARERASKKSIIKDTSADQKPETSSSLSGREQPSL